ncbi:PREDICTED: calcyclin-binding protein [Chaetura pelagica]|uniref:calcyclin-binding protein n=1 Tax=Chaetura pelagica TaxID=8897 RepID=UPI000523C58F|nr:PREDICTED: calcyclin-binding protein [Chaetura pelagica]
MAISLRTAQYCQLLCNRSTYYLKCHMENIVPVRQILVTAGGAGMQGWDQSDKFIKIYISLNGVQKLPAENVVVNFTERSFDLLVKNLNGKNYTMTFNNLLKPISVEGSSKKIKTDTVLVMCRKKQEENWDCLTQVEKESKEKE